MIKKNSIMKPKFIILFYKNKINNVYIFIKILKFLNRLENLIFTGKQYESIKKLIQSKIK
jgi:hypothetical protein